MTQHQPLMTNGHHQPVQHALRPPSSSGRPKTGASTISMSGSQQGNECVKVVVRCRPLSEREHQQGHTACVRIEAKQGIVELENPKEAGEPAKCFTFDAVYDQQARQSDIYDEAVRPIVESVLQGFNGTVFAYGQTGTGKTYTMEGPSGSGDGKVSSEERGIIPNAIEHIFRHIAQSPPNQEYLVRASFLEIYQEEIRDLLDKTGAAKRLELKERPDVGVYVRDLSSFVTQSVEEIDHVLRVGHANRSVGRTNMNEHSSRSHAILVVTVECSEPGPDGQPHIRVGRLNLVDLAGSERQSKTGSEGQRFREATKINLSLSALGNVIAALTDHQSTHVPYRDSKLTRLLQDSLGGNSKTVMIANIGPASYNYEETLSTLRYSSRAKQIQNKPRINEDPKDALLREFQDEIARLKAMLEQRGTKRRRSRKTDRVGSADSAEREAEENFKERQLKLDMERERLMLNSQIIEEEKRRILAELEQREQELERERQEQLAVAAKIRQMQSKLLSGDGNLLDRTRRQEEQLRQKRAELAEQRRREREIAQRLEAQELETAEVRQNFASLQQEVEAKRRKLHKLQNRLQQMRLELRDNEAANAIERQTLEQTVLEMNKELAMKWMIIENFVPPQVVENVKARAIFDENEHKWILTPNGRPSGSALLDRRRSILVETGGGALERLNLLSPNDQPMADSGLGSSNGGGSQGPSETSSQEDGGTLIGGELENAETGTSQPPPLEMPKRPLAHDGTRRPITDFELKSLARLHHRLARIRPKPLTKDEQLNESNGFIMLEFVVHDEVLRFCCENLLTFQSLAQFPSEVRSNLEEPLQKCRPVSRPGTSNSSRIVLDTSRIPVSIQRSASRPNSRPASAAGRRRDSQQLLMAQSAQQLEANGFSLASKINSSQIYGQIDQSGGNEPSKNLRARSVFSSSSAIGSAKQKRMENGMKMPIKDLAKRTPSSPAGSNRIQTMPLPLAPSYPKELNMTTEEYWTNGTAFVDNNTSNGNYLAPYASTSTSMNSSDGKIRWFTASQFSTPSSACDDSSFDQFQLGHYMARPRSRIPVLMSRSCFASNDTLNSTAEWPASTSASCCPSTNSTRRRRRRWGEPSNGSVSERVSENQLVPFVPLWSSPTSQSSREQLSSPDDEQLPCASLNNQNYQWHTNGQNLQEYVNYSGAHYPRASSPCCWTPSAWPTIERAHSLLSKVQNGGRKPAKFHTRPALLRPIQIPMRQRNSPFSGTSSFNESQDMEKWTIGSANVEDNGNSALRGVRHSPFKKRHPNRNHIGKNAFTFMASETVKPAIQAEVSQKVPKLPIQPLEAAIAFAGFALLLRLFSLFLNLLLLLGQGQL